MRDTEEYLISRVNYLNDLIKDIPKEDKVLLNLYLKNQSKFKDEQEQKDFESKYFKPLLWIKAKQGFISKLNNVRGL